MSKLRKWESEYFSELLYGPFRATTEGAVMRVRIALLAALLLSLGSYAIAQEMTK
jgi:hypothetical protein